MPMGDWTKSGDEWKAFTREYIQSLGYKFVREEGQDDFYILDENSQ